MSNPELLAQLRQLSSEEKVKMIQFFTDELAKEKSLNLLENDTVYRAWSPYD